MHEKCIVFSDATSHCADLSVWEGIRKSGKSEDLPEFILVKAFGGKAIVMTPNSLGFVAGAASVYFKKIKILNHGTF